MNYARIIDGVAVDVSHDPADEFHPSIASQFVEVSDEVGSGWRLVDGTWTAPEPSPPAPPPPPVVPQEVPMWAVRTILQNDNLFDLAQALITASSDNALKNIWEYGNAAKRQSPSIAALGAALGLTDAQIDQMFIDANEIVV